MGLSITPQVVSAIGTTNQVTVNGSSTVAQNGAIILATPQDIGTSSSPQFVTQTAKDNSTKVATTAYVDNAILETNYKEAVKYASTAALPSIVYANGSSGVGATLTGVALAAISLDSSSPAVNDRVLIKNQVSDFQNGIYKVTATGSGIAVFVLTRATDFDESADINTGDSVFVTSGSTLSATTWAYTGIDAPTMGTTSLTFVQVAGQGAFTGGNGITITGTSIALTVPVIVANGGTGQTSYTNGQLLIGNTTGNTLTKATLTGTSNQVIVTNGTGSITLSTPQDIATGSSPTFVTETLSGLSASLAVYTNGSKALTSTAPTSGTIGYWSRATTTLTPNTANDIVLIANTTTTGADFAVTNTGIYTGTGIVNITANSATTGDIVTISGTGLTTGSGLVLTGSSATPGMSDALLKLSGNVGGTEGLISSTPTFNPNNGANQIHLNLAVTNAPTSSANFLIGVFTKITDGTSLANKVRAVDAEISLSGNAAKTGHAVTAIASSSSTTGDQVIGVFGQAESSGNIASGQTETVEGLFFTAKATGATSQATAITNLYSVFLANSAVGNTNGTINAYGIFLRSNITHAADAGTINNYGLYIENPTSSTNGTSTKYGGYIESFTGADSNYGLAIGAATDLTLWLGHLADPTTAAGGITFGSSKDTNLYRLAANSLKTDDSFTVGTNLTVTGTSSFNGTVTIGDASSDAVTVNSNAWTFANDTNFVLSGGVNGLSFDTSTLSIDATSHYVGVGTTTPTGPLESFLSAGGVDTSGGGVLVSRVSGGTFRGGAMYSRFINAASVDALVFGVCQTNGKNPYIDFDQARMVITATGNVGIGTTTPTTFLLEMAGNIGPEANKTRDLGSTGKRWNNIYYVAATTGTSRLTKSQTICKDCGETMVRGTGTNYILGETGDYIQVWCEVCGRTQMEKISHQTEELLKQRKQPEKIVLKEVKVQQLSGHTRTVKVDFDYGDNLQNSTILGESELEGFFGLSEKERTQFLLFLGQREWDSVEENRLMEESLKQEQALFDEVLEGSIGKDLM